MFGFAMLIERKLFLYLFVYPFKQLCLTAETGVHLIQLLYIYSAGGIQMVYTLSIVFAYLRWVWDRKGDRAD